MALLALAAAYASSPAMRDALATGWDALSRGDRDRLTAWVRGWGAWGPLVVIVVATLQMFLIVVPSWLLIVASVLVYGAWWGSLLALAATLVASLAGWALGRAAAPATIDRLVGTRALRRTREVVERYGTGAVFVTRLSPLLSNDAVSLVAGLVRMRLAPFLVATAAGLLPLVALVAWLGRDLAMLRTGLAWVFGVSLVGLVAWIVRTRR